MCALTSAEGVPSRAESADWIDVAPPPTAAAAAGSSKGQDEGGLKREPDLDPPPAPQSPDLDEVELVHEQEGDETQQGGEMQRRFTGAARQAAMDRDDGIPLGDDT